MIEKNSDGMSEVQNVKRHIKNVGLLKHDVMYGVMSYSIDLLKGFDCNYIETGF